MGDMTNKCILMFNGDNVKIPLSQDDHWSNYVNPDEMKLAWVAGYSWEVKGFKIISFKIKSTSEFFNGRLLQSLYNYNGFLPSLIEYLEQEKMEGIWFTSIDVINQRFNFNQASNSYKNIGYVCLNHSFSLAAGYITLETAKDMVRMLHRYDKGELAQLEYNFDEHVLRTYYYGNILYCDDMGFAPEMSKKLIHFSRSTLQNYPWKLKE